MGKQNVIYPYRRILFSNKKECRADIYDHMDEPWKCDAKWKKLVTKDHFFYSIYIKCIA